MIRRMLFGRWAIAMMVILFWELNPKQMHAATAYIQHNLVSDIPLLADFTDPNLVNPWGISFTAASPFWICDQGTGLSTVYTASATVQAGTVSTTVVTVPATNAKATGGRCTGQVANTNTAAFAVNGTAVTFIFATEDGSISARVGAVGIIKVDNSAAGAVYKGLALFNSANANYLYAANFNSGKIDVFDGTYSPVTLSGSFTDPAIPAGFAPFNIQNLGGKLFVTYAKQDAAKQNDVAGPGNGYVSVIDTNGNLLPAGHLIANGPLNSPWGVQIAPSTFGDFKGALLVGNFRDGTINAFDPNAGTFLGNLKYPSGKPSRREAFHFRSHDNPYVSEEALRDISKDMSFLSYRQEILAEDTEEAPGALWTRTRIEDARVHQVPQLARVAVGVDPPGGAGECGIVVAGIAQCSCKGKPERHAFVLQDRSLRDVPDRWAKECHGSQGSLGAPRWQDTADRET
jgi:uncharacterized protein (TIGR03118 family)